MTISIIIPAYNEAHFLDKALQEVLDIQEFNEVIVINDGSKDNTKTILDVWAQKIEYRDRLLVINHEINKGKGGALQTGFKAAKGDYLAIHDADLEYDPIDILHMYKVALKDNSDLVIGSRFLGGKPQRISYYLNKVANKLLTFSMNVLYNKTFTDVYCCHKLFKKRLLEGYTIDTRGFEVDAEFLSKMIKYHNPRVIEVPSSYFGRTYEEGKKIKWLDFFQVIFQMVKVRMSSK